MQIWPSEKFEIVTFLSDSEIKKRLSLILAPVSVYTFLNPNKGSNLFEGELNVNSFKIEKIVNGKYIFNPIINGTISQIVNGYKLSISTEFRPPALFLTIFNLFILSLTILYRGWFDEGTIFCGCILAFITIGFKYSSVKSKKILMNLFEAEKAK